MMDPSKSQVPPWLRRNGAETDSKYVSHIIAEQPGSTGKNIGTVCYTPYHATSVTMIIIRGDIDKAVAIEVLAKEGLYPVEVSPGRVTATIIFNDIRSGVVPTPYYEVIFSIDSVKKADVKFLVVALGTWRTILLEPLMVIGILCTRYMSLMHSPVTQVDKHRPFPNILSWGTFNST